jgi:cysteine desulfurase/selenocysteine lyase
MPITHSLDAGGAPHPAAPGLFDVERIRGDFPILRTRAGAASDRPLVYLDNGATTQKPRAVIDAIVKYYEEQCANIHRGVYGLSQLATSLYETVREKVRGFIHAREAAEIIFTRGTTEGINLVASSWGRTHLTRGDWVVISHLEHHSNIVPWQMACAATGAELKVIPIDDAGELILPRLDEFLASGRVRLVSVNHVSNSLGTINPVKQIIAKAHQAHALVMVDGAQWVAHGITDVQDLDCDFYAFSGHKMMGPTGIGILYGKRALFEAMPPWQGGGDMIDSVRFEKTTYAGLPNKFEAGTPDIAGVVGLGAAVDYLAALDLARSSAYEQQLLAYATSRVAQVPGLRIIGTAPLARKASVISFVMDQPPLSAPISTLDIGVALDSEGICVRTGHHCCMPVMDHFGVPATARASFAFYNTRAEVDALVEALRQVSSKQLRKSAESAAQPVAPLAGQTVDYPPASARTIPLAADALAEDFALMEETGGREARNEYVLELGAKVPHLFDLLQKVTDRIPGCMSQVYLVAREKPGATGPADGEKRFEFVADADAEIVRGLIAILQRLYSGQKARDVLSFDIEAFFHRIGLEQFISSQRRNGLAGMVAKIRAAAKEIAG